MTKELGLNKLGQDRQLRRPRLNKGQVAGIKADYQNFVPLPTRIRSFPHRYLWYHIAQWVPKAT